MSNDASKDSDRVVEAARAIFDSRNPEKDFGDILVTTEHTIAVVLLALMQGDPRKASTMLNEGLLQGVEARLSLYAERQSHEQA